MRDVPAIALLLMLAAACGTNQPTPTPVLPLQPSVAVVAGGTDCAEIPQSGQWTKPTGPVAVAVGQVLVVALVVPQSVARSAFPWAPVASSNAEVLRPTAVCGSPMSSLPVDWSAFTAESAGTALLSAGLSPDWVALGGPTDRRVQPIQIRVAVE